MKFIHLKKSTNGLSNTPIELTVVSHSQGNSYRIAFLFSLVKQYNSGLTLSLISERQCKNNHLPQFHQSAAKVTLVGEDGSQISKWIHIDLQHPNNNYDQPFDTIKIPEIRTLYFISQCNLDKLGATIRSTTVEIFFKLKISILNGSRAWSNCSELVKVVQVTQLEEGSFSMADASYEPNSVTDFDFEILSDTGVETIGAHSFMLAARSPVFRKMLFEEDMQEKRPKVVRLSDTTPKILKAFLELLYANVISEEKMNIPVSDALKILTLAHMYQVDVVVEFCMMLIMCYDNDTFDVDDVAQLNQISVLCELPDLTNRCCHWLKWRSKASPGKEEADEFLRTADVDFTRQFCSFLLQTEGPPNGSHQATSSEDW